MMKLIKFISQRLRSLFGRRQASPVIAATSDMKSRGIWWRPVFVYNKRGRIEAELRSEDDYNAYNALPQDDDESCEWITVSIVCGECHHDHTRVFPDPIFVKTIPCPFCGAPLEAQINLPDEFNAGDLLYLDNQEVQS